MEQSAAVWSSSLTQKNSADLERVQKSSVRLIYGKPYESYYNRRLYCLSDRELQENHCSLVQNYQFSLICLFSLCPPHLAISA